MLGAKFRETFVQLIQRDTFAVNRSLNLPKSPGKKCPIVTDSLQNQLLKILKTIFLITHLEGSKQGHLVQWDFRGTLRWARQGHLPIDPLRNFAPAWGPSCRGQAWSQAWSQASSQAWSHLRWHPAPPKWSHSFTKVTPVQGKKKQLTQNNDPPPTTSVGKLGEKRTVDPKQ